MTIKNIKNTLLIPINGYKAIFALMKGDVDTAYNLTHSKKDKRKTKKENKNHKNENFTCPGCQRTLNNKVKKCVCGMEFK